MELAGPWSRRTFLISFLAGLAARQAWGADWAASVSEGPAALLRGFPRMVSHQRRYRIDATILFCGIPVFSRQRVGGGYAAIEIGGDPQSRAVALQFAAGSWPERSRNLNRLGILWETVVEHGDGLLDAAFAGLITSSKEETFDQARNALLAGRVTDLLIARGVAANGSFRTWNYTAELPLQSDWTAAASMLGGFLPREPRGTYREVSASAAATLLSALHRAALCPDRTFRCSFVHAGKIHTLETRRMDGKSVELDGLIRDPSGAKTSEFRVHYAAGDASGLPIRIDYRAKSYLRLTFEEDRSSTQPPIPSLFGSGAF